MMKLWLFFIFSSVSEFFLQTIIDCQAVCGLSCDKAKAMEIVCEYSKGKCTLYHGQYTCVVTGASITKPNTRILAFHGIHLPGKSGRDVEALKFVDSVLDYFPRGLHRVFPNLKAVFTTKCSITKISRRDLKGLENLTGFGIVSGQLTSLPNDLFLDMSKLKHISFCDNNIGQLSSQLFTPAMRSELNYAAFSQNANIDAIFDPENAEFNEITIDELLAVIDNNCVAPDDEASKSENFEYLSKVSQGLAKLWASKRFSDFTITAESQKFQVHKFILTTQSTVFQTIFDNDLEESKTSEMRIDDFSAAAVEDFLRYLYIGDVENDTNAMELYQMAHKYDVAGLAKICQDIILDNLDASNAYDILRLGQLHSSEDLKSFALIEIRKMFDVVFSDISTNNVEGLIKMIEQAL